MAITRKVDTDVYCDICGKWVMGWTSNNDGVSRAWAAKYARKKGCTVGKKIICKECRIEKRIKTCSIQQKIGSAGRDSDGTCMGFGGEASDADMIGLVCNTIRKLFCMSDEGYETFLMDLEDYKSKLEEEE